MCTGQGNSITSPKFSSQGLTVVSTSILQQKSVTCKPENQLPPSLELR